MLRTMMNHRRYMYTYIFCVFIIETHEEHIFFETLEAHPHLKKKRKRKKIRFCFFYHLTHLKHCKWDYITNFKILIVEGVIIFDNVQDWFQYLHLPATYISGYELLGRISQSCNCIIIIVVY